MFSDIVMEKESDLRKTMNALGVSLASPAAGQAIHDSLYETAASAYERGLAHGKQQAQESS